MPNAFNFDDAANELVKANESRGFSKDVLAGITNGLKTLGLLGKSEKFQALVKAEGWMDGADDKGAPEDGAGAPDGSPAHEAMETPAEEKLEHETGKEKPDEGGAAQEPPAEEKPEETAAGITPMGKGKADEGDVVLLDVEPLIKSLGELPDLVKSLVKTVANLQADNATLRAQVQRIGAGQAELAKSIGTVASGIGEGLTALVKGQGETIERIVARPGQHRQPRAPGSTIEDRVLLPSDGSTLTVAELAKAVDKDVITTHNLTVYKQHGRFCVDEDENNKLVARVRAVNAS